MRDAVARHDVDVLIVDVEITHVVVQGGDARRRSSKPNRNLNPRVVGTKGDVLEARANHVALVVVHEVFLVGGERLAEGDPGLGGHRIPSHETVPVLVPAVLVNVDERVGPVQGIKAKVDFPPVWQSIAKGREGAAEAHAVPRPVVAVRVQRVGAQPDVLVKHRCAVCGARGKEVGKGHVRGR